MSTDLWWRDDDAGRDDARLDRLLALAAHHRRPVALAVVPAWLEPGAIQRITASPWATVLQHGVAHTDHAAPGERKVELGGTADRVRLCEALAAGRERLACAFGSQFLAVLVPPWNRIAADVIEGLPGLGYLGLSCDGGPPRTRPLRRIDTHVDAVDWPAGARPRRADELEAMLTAAIADQAGAPVGLLTHHQVVDNTGWDDLDRALRFGHDNEAVVWRSATKLFGEP